MSVYQGLAAREVVKVNIWYLGAYGVKWALCPTNFHTVKISQV